MERIYKLKYAETTRDVIEAIDELYNLWVEPGYEQTYGTLEHILSVTMEELAEYSWKDFLTEEMYEENLEAYLDKVSQDMTATRTPDSEEKEELSDQEGLRKKKGGRRG